MANLETKTKKIIKEGIQQGKNFMKETSQKTYAEITKKHKDNVKSIVTEQKKNMWTNKKISNNERITSLYYGKEEPIGETKVKKGELGESVLDKKMKMD